ncbi:probable ATP-dependent RNA helicase Dbp45A [Teleopsis dalmanni]|uniref:probable ATP-dependent RNA helicase Dbp45A n=1 Tax=Teleopsis dalmanni TaxID=139649 RepID=UPI0018CE2A7E|nr:probable ATP-dependent RNA helicase Dbp45A [Teleopsis dalmanni]
MCICLQFFNLSRIKVLQTNMSRKSDDPFAALGLRPWLTKQLQKLGLKGATPIQRNCIPAILAGKDCIGAAKTGSGKTFAFALPILEKLSAEPVSHFALILTPTHELAYQISEQFLVAGQSMGVRVCVVSGGTDQMIETQKLMQRPHIVVAMPGRLADHLTFCKDLSFDNMKYLVVDEADRMLNGDFDESLAIIESNIPKERQNLFFSATMKDFIKESSIFPITTDCFEWSEEFEVATVDTLDQRYLLCAEYDRDMVLIEALRKFREENENANVMIFTNTKKYCQLLSMTLNNIEIENVCLHGFMRQKERVSALNRFKSNHIRTLIATDVAARGLDITGLPFMINVTLPDEKSNYVHRIGRVGRAERMGLAISLVASVPEKVWYHGDWCQTRGRNCHNTNLTDVRGCCIWYNERNLLAEVEEHLNITIQQVDKKMVIPVNDFDGKVVYGQKNLSTGTGYKDHVQQLIPVVRKLNDLELQSQSLFLKRLKV